MEFFTSFCKIIVVFRIAFIISGCSDKNPVVPPIENNNSFGIYFLKDTTLTIEDILNTDFEDLELADKPWLIQDDIEFYDWSSHCIYLKKDKSYLFPDYFEGYYQLPNSWTDRPWIVVVNKTVCYKGYFVTDASIDTYPYPEISGLEAGTWGYPKDIITSDWIFLLQSDPRDNEVVKERLIQCGLYHGGIEVSLDTATSPIKVYNGDTTSVEYTLRIKNNDNDNLYVFDPEKVDNEIFHYYNYGPDFINVTNKYLYRSQYMITREPDGWDNGWYTLLKSGETIKRTIILKGYPFIPSGTYWIQGGYAGPKEGLEKNIRETQLGRYWIGYNLTDTLRVTINNQVKNIE
jgi:hypothetical protein